MVIYPLHADSSQCMCILPMLVLNDGFSSDCLEYFLCDMKKAWVYILTNKKKSVLYIGVTSDLPGRLEKHVNAYYKGFASKYGCDTLIYFEEFNSILDAIDREKELKGWSRAKKEALINTTNPGRESLNHKFV